MKGWIGMVCPVCGGKATGKVGVDQFYCWDCCVEYRKNNNEVQVFDVDEEGALVAWEDDFQPF